MKKTLLLLTATLLVSGAGRQIFMKIPKSQFLTQFSLGSAVKNLSDDNLDCAPTAVGRAGGVVGGGRNSQEGDYHKLDGVSCTLKKSLDKGFDEASFIKRLQVEIEKEILSSGAAISNSDLTTANNFFFEYKDGDAQGEISVSGSVSGSYYNLVAKIDERIKKAN